MANLPLDWPHVLTLLGAVQGLFLAGALVARKRNRIANPLSLVVAVVACASPAAPEVEGAWGGSEASLTLMPSGGTIQYQCGAGTIDSGWTLSADGVFAATGEHYVGGGPVPPGGRPPHPAVYAGQVSGSVLTLTVTLTDLAESLGPFRLVRGGPVVTEICL